MKLKTKKSVLKRIKVTKNFFFRKKAYKNHLLRKKTNKQFNRLSKLEKIYFSDFKKIYFMVPYL
jgi:ribosomal protein L35